MKRHRLARTVLLLLSTFGAGAGSNACRAIVADESVAEASAISVGSPSLFRPGNRFGGWGGQGDEYLDEVQPILAKRCVTCHGCSSAPCQLKLTSYEGVKRGANAHNLFQVSDIELFSGPTRMKDGNSVDEWRKKGFYTVVDGVDGRRDPKISPMFRLLQKGNAEHTEGFDLAQPFSLYDKKAEVFAFECLDNTRALEARIAQPGAGMPFGLTSLPQAEYEKLIHWIDEGSPGPSAASAAMLARPRDSGVVANWEEFFNRTTPKGQLAARYMYEHLAFARIHFDDSESGRGDFYELVRAKGRTGPIEELVTETPVDDPGGPFFYRLKKHTQVITAKDHVVYRLSAAVQDRWRELFFGGKLDAQSQPIYWDVKKLPDYDDPNPFVNFQAIPGVLRDQFMLENSEHIVEGMVKGDVCTGVGATYAIRDRFFSLFLKPTSDPFALDPKLGEWSYAHLKPSATFLTAGAREADFQGAFQRELKRLKPNGLAISDIWDGGKTDQNAWITIFRHGTNASAHKGPMGQQPETMWVMDYGNFERLFYDLVVLYKPWARVGHKLSTWNTMSHVRAHGEDLFLMFFPEDMRQGLREKFTPGVLATFSEHIMAGEGIPSTLNDIDRTRPIEDFVSRVRAYLGPQIAPPGDPLDGGGERVENPTTRSEIERTLFDLTTHRGNIATGLPETTWLLVDTGVETLAYTLLANRRYSSNSRVIGNKLSSLTRLPESDSVSVIRGWIGAFPELFMRVPVAELRSAVDDANGSPQKRNVLLSKYGIARNTTAFWSFFEMAHERLIKERPLDSGIIDTSKYLWTLGPQPQPLR